MGVLNVTPDSFSDGGKYNNYKFAKRQFQYLLKSGADLIDIGGESTRPGSKSVSLKVEWNRIQKILKKNKKINFISLDTRKSDIMEKGIRLGVKLINDVSGLNYDKNSIKILKKSFLIDNSAYRNYKHKLIYSKPETKFILTTRDKKSWKKSC